MQQRIVLNRNELEKASAGNGRSLPSIPGVDVIDLTEDNDEIAQTWPFNCVRGVGEVVTIPAPVYFASASPLDELARLLLVGRRLHLLCRESFVVKMVKGYYGYERREEWRTCAVAAALVGLYGPDVIERDVFSYSQAVFQLNRHVGYNLDQLWVLGPTGRLSTVYDEMVLLTDTNYWTRRGVADWLPLASVVQGRMGS